MGAVEDGLRKEMEKCESLDALLWVGHTSGASSGGLMKAITSKVNLDKKREVLFYGYPSPNFTTSHHEPYNALLNISDSSISN